MSRPRASSPAPPLEDDDLLREILLLPLPSSLLCASLVCTRWRRLVPDTRFVRSFCARHRKPPLLGFLSQYGFSNPSRSIFTPALDPPDRIPEVRFRLPMSSHELSRSFTFNGCRHGLALCLNHGRREVIVWDPITGHQRCGADNDCDHMKGDCLYESKSGVWGNIISTATTRWINVQRPNILVGNTLCWLLNDKHILEFDFEKHSLAVIEMPADARHTNNYHKYYQILRTKDSGLGLVMLTGLTIKLWGRKLNSEGVAIWVLQKSVLLDKLHPLVPSMDKIWPFILGYDEDHDLILLGVENHVITAQLDSMQFKKLFDRPQIKHKRFFESNEWTTYYPYTSFYAGGVGGGDDGPEMLNST